MPFITGLALLILSALITSVIALASSRHADDGDRVLGLLRTVSGLAALIALHAMTRNLYPLIAHASIGIVIGVVCGFACALAIRCMPITART